MFKKIATATAALVPTFALAAPVDYTALTAQVDFSTTIAAILVVAGVMVGVYIAWKGAKMIISAVRGA